MNIADAALVMPAAPGAALLPDLLPIARQADRAEID
jgi:hypothetical protein